MFANSTHFCGQNASARTVKGLDKWVRGPARNWKFLTPPFVHMRPQDTIDVKKTLTPRIKNVKKRVFYEKNKKPLKNVE